MTVAERRIVKDYICRDEDEELDEIEKWPPEVCYPLFEILDMIQFAITVGQDIWNMSQFAINLTTHLLEIASKLEWFPIFGEIIKRDIDALNKLLIRVDDRALKRLAALQEYFEKVEKYSLMKCYDRKY